MLCPVSTVTKYCTGIVLYSPVRVCNPAPQVDRNEPIKMTHGCGHDITATIRPPPILSPNLQTSTAYIIQQTHSTTCSTTPKDGLNIWTKLSSSIPSTGKLTDIIIKLSAINEECLDKYYVKISAYSDKHCQRISILKTWTDRTTETQTDVSTDKGPLKAEHSQTNNSVCVCACMKVSVVYVQYIIML